MFLGELLFLLFHKQVGHIAKDRCCAEFTRQIAFFKGGAATDLVFGKREQTACTKPVFLREPYLVPAE